MTAICGEREREKRKDVKEILTKQGTTVKYIDLINRFIRKLGSRLNYYCLEGRVNMILWFGKMSPNYLILL